MAIIYVDRIPVLWHTDILMYLLWLEMLDGCFRTVGNEGRLKGGLKQKEEEGSHAQRLWYLPLFSIWSQGQAAPSRLDATAVRGNLICIFTFELLSMNYNTWGDWVLDIGGKSERRSLPLRLLDLFDYLTSTDYGRKIRTRDDSNKRKQEQMPTKSSNCLHLYLICIALFDNHTYMTLVLMSLWVETILRKCY